MLPSVPLKPSWQEGTISLRKLYKAMILLLGYLSLLAFWHLSQNGRYTLHDTSTGAVVLDTRTGQVSYPRAPTFENAALEP
jgi:hypothetical protein